MKRMIFILLLAATITFGVTTDDVIEWAEKNGCKFPHLLAAIAYAESSYRPEVVSHAGAVGLFQFMPATATDISDRLGYDFEPTDAQQATYAAQKYLEWLFKHFKLYHALIAWNWGYGNTMKYLDGELAPLPYDTLVFLWNVSAKYSELTKGVK